MTGQCLPCDAVTRIEKHHPAGRRNNAGFTVDVCNPCHRELTVRQQAIGMALRGGCCEWDKQRASLVGALQVWQLWTDHHVDPSHPLFHLPGLLARLFTHCTNDEKGCIAWNVKPHIEVTA